MGENKRVKTLKKCDDCSYSTLKSYRLKRHQSSVHNKGERYFCDTCEYGAPTQTQVDQHIKRAHFNIRDFACDKCNFKTYRNDILNGHIKEKHLKQFRWECTLCDYKGQAGSVGKKRHYDTRHLGIKPYKCKDCEKEFADLNSKKKHQIAKHSNEKPFICEECGFSAAWKSSLDKHRHRDGTWIPRKDKNVSNQTISVTRDSNEWPTKANKNSRLEIIDIINNLNLKVYKENIENEILNEF